MKIKFVINYQTRWGEQLMIKSSHSRFTSSLRSDAMHMDYMGNGQWQAEVDLAGTVEELRYNYLLYREENGTFKEEWGVDRCVSLIHGVESYLCIDQWSEGGSVENVFMTSPFQQVWFKNEQAESARKKNKLSHVFMVKAVALPGHLSLCLLGSESQLGHWNISKPQLMVRNGDSWFFEAKMQSDAAEIYYKYGVYDNAKREFLYFEQGENRVVPIVADTLVQKNDGFIHTGQTAWRAAGVGLPMFSIRTKSSLGVGDFVDLKALVDWAAHVDLKLIQLLPLNDTIGTHTELDVLPYAAISAFALNPLYLNLQALGRLPEHGSMTRIYGEKQAQLNAQDLVPFMDVIQYKLAFAREAFDYQKKNFINEPEFQNFYNKNAFWLDPYAAFCVLRDRYKTSNYTHWEEYAAYNSSKIKALLSSESTEIAFHYFLQFHLHKQLHEAGRYAAKKGVVLKGDIPIGVNRNSVDTWANPSLFHLDHAAGAPPDMFAVKGQNWSLPTYNWEEMKATGYKWWKQRFEHMTNYFDTFRIDHILGFFRIWQIPNKHIEGIMGHLSPSVPIYLEELHAKGINFEYNRFCQPYITDQILRDFFGADEPWVRANCLQVEDGWKLRLKPEFSSQANVVEMVEVGAVPAHLKEPLLDLISNILLIEVEGSYGNAFYPRYGMHYLRTFAELDDASKRGLDELYIDYFYRRQDHNWYYSGMEKLPAMKRATNMLICGEDLGMMNPSVTAVMKELGILSLEIQRAPKTDDIEFAHPHFAPYLSVVTPSTHDMTTLRGWWEEDRSVTQRFYNNQLNRDGEAPYFCEWWVVRDIVLQHLYSPAILAVFQWQDLIGMSEKLRRNNPHDERINDPSNSEASWRYRMHINLEDLMKEVEFNKMLRDYIRQSGR